MKQINDLTNKATYKVRVGHIEYEIFSIVEVDAVDKYDAWKQAKVKFEWITGTPIERSQIGYTWIPKEHQYPNR